MAQRIRVRREMHAAEQRLVVAAVLHARRGERHGAVGPAVEAAAEGDDRRAPRRHLGELDRGFDRLGPGVRQEERRIGAARKVPRQALVQQQPGLVVDDVLLAVDELRRLLRDRRRDPRMRMPGADHADPRGVVEVAFATDRLQPGAGAALDDQVGVAGPDGRHAVAQRQPRRRIGQKVGGVLIHSSRVSPPASLRQRCGRMDGKVSESPSASR